MEKIIKEIYEDCAKFGNYNQEVSQGVINSEKYCIESIEEEFMRDIFNNLLKKDENFSLEIHFLDSEDKFDGFDVMVEWNWPELERKGEILFKRNRINITETQFYNEIKSYLFDLVASIASLR